MREEVGFWAAVGVVAVIAVVLFKLAGASGLGDRLPALRRLAATI